MQPGGNMNRIILFFLCTICSVLILNSPTYAARDFTITNFDVLIFIDESGEMQVIETIEVFFHKSRHGIYREIPYKYKDDLGNTITMPIDVSSVRDENDNRWKTKIRKSGNVVNIRIGDADVYVKGKQVYKIAYTVDNALLFFEDHDELYWNITGNYWDAYIEKASATIVLQTDKSINTLEYDCYTGRYGSSATDCEAQSRENKGIYVVTSESLRPREGLTIAMGWDKGIVSEPSDFEKFMMRTNFKENIFFLLPIISLLFMYFHWRKHGRDPKTREAVMVQYEPPTHNGKELTPAELGTLIDESFDQRDISASIIGLAVKGYLTIEDSTTEVLFLKKTDYQLTQLKDPDDNLTEFEQKLMNAVFKIKKSVKTSDLKGEFFEHIYPLQKTIFRQLVAKSYFKTSPVSVIWRYVGYAFVTLIFTLLFLFFAIDFDYKIKAVAIAVLTSIPIFIFSRAMPAKTRTGATALSNVLGFQEFLRRAEKDRLERMNDKQLFSKYLPYAIALDVVDLWAKAFDGIEQEKPNWFVSTHAITTFNPVLFSHAITHTASHLGNATFSAPRSSGLSGGGGGGGFSGGGGGGGGGGSW